MNLKKIVIGSLVVCLLFLYGSSIMAFGPVSGWDPSSTTQNDFCSSVQRNPTNSTLGVIFGFSDSIFRSYVDKILNITQNTSAKGGAVTWNNNDFVNKTNGKCDTKNSGYAWDSNEKEKQEQFFSDFGTQITNRFPGYSLPGAILVLPSGNWQIQSYVTWACGIPLKRDGKFGVKTLNAIANCKPPCEGKCGREFFSKYAEGGQLKNKNDGQAIYQNGGFQAIPSVDTICLDLSSITTWRGKAGDFDLATKTTPLDKTAFKTTYGLDLCEPKTVEYTKCKVGTDFLLTDNGFDKLQEVTAQEHFVSSQGMILTGYANIVKIDSKTSQCCINKKQFGHYTLDALYGMIASHTFSDGFSWSSNNVKGYATNFDWSTVVQGFCPEVEYAVCKAEDKFRLTQDGFSSLQKVTFDEGDNTISDFVKKEGDACCVVQAGNISLDKYISAIVNYDGSLGVGQSNLNIIDQGEYSAGTTADIQKSSIAPLNNDWTWLQFCKTPSVTQPPTQTCPFDIPSGQTPKSEKENKEYSPDEHNKGKLKDACGCKKGYTKKNMLFGDENTYSVCQKCSIEKCNCGIKLNTNVPFIGRCIVYGDTNETDDVSYTSGDNSVIVVNPLNAFPVLMGGIVKILMTVIMLVCFGSLIVAGFMMTVPGQYDTGKKLLWKVVYAIALLGVSGVVLYIINPNFFF